MYTLVKFYDDIYYVCKSSQIKIKKNVAKAIYSDKRSYPATILAKNDNKDILEDITKNIITNKPHILCKRTDFPKFCDINSIRLIDKNRDNESVILNKEYNTKKIDVSLNIGESHMIMSMDESNKNNESVPNKDCNEEMTDVTSNTGCHQKPTLLNGENEIYDKREEEITMIIDDSDYQEDIGTIIFTDENEKSIKTVMPNNFLMNNNIKAADANEIADANIFLSDSLNGSVLINEECVRRLSFNTTDNDNDKSNDEGSEYIHSEHSSLHSESSENQMPIVNRTVSSISSFDTSNTNVVGTSACNDEVMCVQKSNIKSKQNYCVFCMKLQSQLARHLETVHLNEPDVKKFAILPKKNPERKKIIDTIRKMGNFKFNTNSEFNTGQLIVCRRPNEKTNKTAKDFVACVKCKGFFAKSTIRHHARVCLKKDFRKNKNIMIMGRKITGRIHSIASECLRKTVFPVLREDDVTRIVRYDKLLIIYANKLCVKYISQHQHDMIRARLRLLGRFLIALKEINTNVEDFQSLYHPQIYDDCISAINVVAGYDNEGQLYKTPAVAANLSTLIKHIGNLLIMECIKTQDEEKKKLVKDFLKLLVVDIGTSVNKTVLETQSAHKRHKKINLPSLEDIKKLYTHLAKIRTEAYAALNESFSYEKWISLTEVTLTSTHVFNRRRAGEIERALIEDFENYEKVNKNMYSDIYKSLSMEDRKIAEKYVRFCIRGKLGRTVPVLLTNELFDCITLILKYREKANVPKKNPYIFGLPAVDKNRHRYLRACVLMRTFAEQCNANQSTTLRGTTLRKHVATHCIQFNLNDTDVSDLATFMGHADKIHRDHYRQPIASRDILKISRYLEAVSEGNTQNINDESMSDSDFEIEDNLVEVNNNNTDETNSPLCEILKHSKNSDKQTDKQGGKRKRSTSPYGKTKRVRWTEDEKKTALSAFAQHMENYTLPSLKEIQEVKKKYISLARRTSPQIKTWLHNKLKTLRQQ